MMPGSDSPALDLARDLVAQAHHAHQRRMLWLAGEQAWCRARAIDALAAYPSEPVLWIAQSAPPGAWCVPGAGCHQVLGREVHGLVFDAWDGFDADAFGAATGTLAGGGLLLLLSPPPEHWPDFQDPEHARITVAPHGPEAVTGRYLRRLVRVLRQDPTLLLWQQGQVPTDPGASPIMPAASSPVTAEATSEPLPQQRVAGPPDEPAAPAIYRTPDQAQAVAAVVKVATGQRRRPVVLTADRGRGKSAALGIAAAELMQMRPCRIAVTGPRLEAVQAVFDHARAQLPEAHSANGVLQTEHAELRFVAPDQLLAAPRPLDLLLVDEAAALPTPLLAALLRHYNRIAFATTVHGYEGSGRGFALRFDRLLDAGTRGWRGLRLETPIRWAADDPLEALSFRALLLDAEPASDASINASSGDGCRVEILDRERLTDDEATLGGIFGLLVLAHYRTRPYDLRHLLDGPNLSVLILRGEGTAGEVIGTALVAAEGGFDATAAHAIWAGRSRPHGHLLPESLAAHLGLEQAPRLRCLRVMRIAIHPAARRRGLGRRLLRAISDHAANLELDYLGASFGADPALMAFWRGADYHPVRVSIKAGAASAAHSVIMLKPLSQPGHALCTLARERYFSHLPQQLADHLQTLDPPLALDLLQGITADTPLDAHDHHDLRAFSEAHRVYEACLGPLYKQALQALSLPPGRSPLSTEQRALLLRKLLQRQSWEAVARAHGLSGRRRVTAALRAAYARLGHTDTSRGSAK